jgi:hypothetical protein
MSSAVGKYKLVVDVRFVLGSVHFTHSPYWLYVCVCVVITTNDASSCRRKDDKWVVAMNKWQDLTDMEVNKGAAIL